MKQWGMHKSCPTVLQDFFFLFSSIFTVFKYIVVGKMSVKHCTFVLPL